jgi:hypothetical protein
LGLLFSVTTVSAFNNTPPIPSRHAGWSEGKGRLGIEIELFLDLLCDGCAMVHPEFKEFLKMNYSGTPVIDLVHVNYAFFGLPYHHAAWIPHRLLPYIINECYQGVRCRFDQYVNYTLTNRNFFLD